METKKHILLVEDNERLRTNLLFMLNREGFDAKGAINGTEALGIIQQETPDLIISDIMMPDMDGYSLVKNLRQLPETISVPVIFLTAKSSHEDLRAGMQYGVDDYLTKPVDINDLLTTIRVRLERSENEKKKLLTNLRQLQLHLASILPHELRTPISGIIGASSFLQSDFDTLSHDDIMELHACIETSAKRLARLAENFLQYIQLLLLMEEREQFTEAHSHTSDTLRKTQAYQLTDLPELIQEVASLCGTQRNRASDIRLSVSDAMIHCNKIHFEKVLYEIIDNALQFSAAATPVEIQSEQTSDTYILRITDYGRGMSEEQIQTLNEYPTIFKQFDRKIYEQQGMGMGLVLSYLIMQVFQGSLTITGEQNHKTTVTLEFPIVSSQEKSEKFQTHRLQTIS